jgi:predicted dehydrogenase
MRTRRQFLHEMLAATAAASAASRVTLAAESTSADGQSSSPNEKLGVAVIGVNGRGKEHIRSWLGRKDVEIRYIVDPDEAVGGARTEEVAKQQAKTQRKAPKFVRDLREALEDKAVDFVSIATPNHWHALAAIWAMQAGKDVYVEKPVSHNVSEGRRIVEAARKYNKICQTGTQSRSAKGMREAIAFVREGKIGDVSVARGTCYKRRASIGSRGVYAVPSEVNYDLWSGPAPLAELTRPKFHYDWHWQWLCGNGDLGNQGIHQMDIARWGLGVSAMPSSVVSYGGRWGYEDAGETANTQILSHDYGDKSLIFEVRGLATSDYRGAKIGVIFEGSEGYMVVGSYETAVAFDKSGKEVRKFSGGGDHFGNFVDAVRSRKIEDLHADILEGHLSSALCHLGNISYRLGSTMTMAEAGDRVKQIKTHDNAVDTFTRMGEHLKANHLQLDKLPVQFGQLLNVDLGTESFIGSDAANAMLTREYRAPFVVPAAGAV